MPRKLLGVFAALSGALSVFTFTLFISGTGASSGVSAPPTSDYLNIAIYASLLALLAVLLLLFFRRRSKKR